MGPICDLYEYHLWFLGAWIFCSLIQVSFELAGWKMPSQKRNVALINYQLNIFLGYPAIIVMVICFVFLYNSTNFQFLTYIIFILASCILLYAGLYSAFLIHRRKEQYKIGDEEAAEGSINRLRLCFLISIPAAVLAAAAELHIMTNWITEFLF